MPRYAVKFVCGKSDGRVVAPGDYWTAINVHNPTEEDIDFKKRFAIALPGERPGPVTETRGARLGPYEAFEIDRENIWEHTGSGSGDFLKGFVVIYSELELDVVAVYSVIGQEGDIALHIERVAPSAIG